MYIACEKGNINFIKLLLTRKDIDVNMHNEEIFFFFLIFLLDFYLNVNGTPLHIACIKNDIESVKLLLSCENIQVNVNCNCVFILFFKSNSINNNFEWRFEFFLINEFPISFYLMMDHLYQLLAQRIMLK